MEKKRNNPTKKETSTQSTIDEEVVQRTEQEIAAQEARKEEEDLASAVLSTFGINPADADRVEDEIQEVQPQLETALPEDKIDIETLTINIGLAMKNYDQKILFVTGHQENLEVLVPVLSNWFVRDFSAEDVGEILISMKKNAVSQQYTIPWLLGIKPSINFGNLERAVVDYLETHEISSEKQLAQAIEQIDRLLTQEEKMDFFEKYLKYPSVVVEAWKDLYQVEVSLDQVETYFKKAETIAYKKCEGMGEYFSPSLLEESLDEVFAQMVAGVSPEVANDNLG